MLGHSGLHTGRLNTGLIVSTRIVLLVQTCVEVTGQQDEHKFEMFDVGFVCLDTSGQLYVLTISWTEWIC